MKYDVGIGSDWLDIKKISGKESIINIFVKNLIAVIGTDFFNPLRGTNLLMANSEGRAIVEVESAVKQTSEMTMNNARRFGNVFLNKVNVIDIVTGNNSLKIILSFIFSDKEMIPITLEVAKDDT